MYIDSIMNVAITNPVTLPCGGFAHRDALKDYFFSYGELPLHNCPICAATNAGIFMDKNDICSPSEKQVPFAYPEPDWSKRSAEKVEPSSHKATGLMESIVLLLSRYWY